MENYVMCFHFDLHLLERSGNVACNIVLLTPFIVYLPSQV